MRFYEKKKKREKYADWTFKKKFAWLPTKIYGQYSPGYGQMGYVWLEFYWEETHSEWGKHYSLLN